MCFNCSRSCCYFSKISGELGLKWPKCKCYFHGGGCTTKRITTILQVRFRLQMHQRISFRGANAWNKLDSGMKLAPSIQSFKVKLKALH